MIYFKKIRWKNFLSYGNHWTELNLDENKSSLIIGENGAGKSTVLDALTYVLYNKPFRKITVQQLVNSINTNHMEVEVDFTIGKNNYKVCRGQKPRIFEVYQDEILLNQEAHAKDYQEILEKQILKLNHKSFCQVVVLGSSSFIPFMQLPTNHRKEVIEDLLDIGIFSIMGSLLKDRASENRKVLSNTNNEIALLQERVNMQREYVKRIMQQKDEAIQEKKMSIEKLSNTNGILELNLTDDESKVTALRKEVEEEEAVRKKLNKLNNLDSKIGDKVKRLKKEIAFFETHDDCPTCYRPIDKETKSHSIENNKDSITGQYLSNKKRIDIPKTRRLAKNGRFVEINGASGNNLNNVNLKIPTGSFTCVTGVSGSGKSTLILQTLYHALNLTLNSKARKVPKAFKSYKGVELIDKIIDIDQSPIGRTPRSNPATYTGAFGPIRDWFTALPESKTRGYKPGRFSFNVKGGRCEACEGDGVITYEMHFLPDVYIQCDECKGTRYNRETLEIKFKDKSIADVLDMSVDEGCEYFENISNIKTKLLTLKKVGLGYIKIGQQATTLSGGEAQRIKLAKELSKRSTGRTMYILDEPTTGLHQHDIKKLLEILHTFVALGNTVVVIEHNLDVIKTADYIVDMGPEGGVKGGNIIAEGKPEDIVKIKGSYTGEYLKPMLEDKFKKKVKNLII